MNWKDNDAEGDRKALCSLGEKSSELGRAEGGELCMEKAEEAGLDTDTEWGKQGRGRNDGGH